MRNRRLSIFVCIAAVAGATLAAAAQLSPANMVDPNAPTAATLTPEQINAQWIAANSKYDGQRKRILANAEEPQHSRREMDR